MVCRTAIVLVALIASVPPASADEEHAASLRLNTLPAGQKLHIFTAERAYRVKLVHPETGEAWVAGSLDGKQYSPPQKMFFVGATRGPQPDDGGFSLVLMGELREGMRIEWCRDSLDSETCGSTSPVRSIVLDRAGTDAGN
jgi:hypothetical protein